jgi:hypothetical protein
MRFERGKEAESQRVRGKREVKRKREREMKKTE